MAITKYLVSALAVAGLAFAKGECITTRWRWRPDTPKVMKMMMVMEDDGMDRWLTR